MRRCHYLLLGGDRVDGVWIAFFCCPVLVVGGGAAAPSLLREEATEADQTVVE